MDTKNIERLFGCIMERLDRQEQMLEDLRNKRPEQLANAPEATKLLNGERLYDNQDLCLMLQVSKRSLQRYRSIGILPYLMLRQKSYYKESDVEKFLSEHLDEINKDRVEAYKARIR